MSDKGGKRKKEERKSGYHIIISRNRWSECPKEVIRVKKKMENTLNKYKVDNNLKITYNGSNCIVKKNKKKNIHPEVIE